MAGSGRFCQPKNAEFAWKTAKMRKNRSKTCQDLPKPDNCVAIDVGQKQLSCFEPKIQREGQRGELERRATAAAVDSFRHVPLNRKPYGSLKRENELPIQETRGRVGQNTKCRDPEISDFGVSRNSSVRESCCRRYQLPSVTVSEIARHLSRATFSNNRRSGVAYQRVAADALTNVRTRERQFVTHSGARL